MGKTCEIVNVFFFHCSMATLEKRLIGRGTLGGRKDDRFDTIHLKL